MGVVAKPIDLTGIRWDYLSAEGESWLARQGQELAGGKEVRSTSRRGVVLLDGCYIKEVRYPGWRRFIKRLDGGNAVKEGRTTQRLAEMGVAVPVVLAFGRQVHAGGLSRDMLLTQEVPSAGPLRPLMFDNYPRLPASRKRDFTRRFAGFIRGLHDLGIEHRDLHIGNILVQGGLAEGRFLLLDTDRVRCHAQPLDMRRRAANLSQVLTNFWKLSSRSERFRFLRSYCGDSRPFAGLAALIEDGSLSQSRKIWHKRACRTLVNGQQYNVGKRSGWSFWCLNMPDAQTALQELLPDPDQALDGGRAIKKGKTVRAAMTVIGGTSIFLKRYNDKGYWYRFRNAFRRSRALKTWLMTWEFLERGLPVSMPLVCLEQRRWQMLRQTYLVSRFIDGRQIPEVWQDASSEERIDLLVRIAIILGLMHRFGCIHGDLKWSNLLIDADGDVRLIDLDGSRVCRWNARSCTKDIQRFIADTHRYRVSDTDRKIFVSVWKRWAFTLR
jgi:tRNA A-37 threonylcarbamoyl transferase component Bud32